MDLRGFLERVLPLAGSNYFGAAVGSNKKLTQSRLNSIDALERYIKANYRNDVYFATGTYIGRRDAKSTELKKAFYLDIDCGSAQGKYPNKQAAAQAVITFCKTKFLPPSLIIDSGGGLHCYWVLTKAVPPARWVRSAEALKQLCVTEGLHADPTPTADLARILRAPFTLNHKDPNNPRVAHIVHEAPTDYDIETIEAKLVVSATPSLTLAVDNDDLFAGQASKHTYYAAKVVEECPMFADALATGGAGLAEVLWTQQLHVLAYCEDGEQYAHEISKGYAGYAETETRMKWNQRIKAKEKAGPVLCSTFAKQSPHCATCPHNGLVKTPLLLGGQRSAGVPFPYDQDDDGLFIMISDTDSAGTPVSRKFYIFPKVEQLRVSKSDTGLIVHLHTKKNGKELQADIEYPHLLDSRAFFKAFSRAGLAVTEKQAKFVKDCMTSWVSKMLDAKAPSRAVGRLGWDGDGFALATKVLLPNGKEAENTGGDSQLVALYTPQGSRDPWITAAHLITKQQRHAATAIIMTAFASPLLRWLRDPSAVVAFVSTRSGSGKTTGLQLAQTVWGSKEGMNQLHDTNAAILKRTGFCYSIPSYWDEVRASGEAEKFVDMMFQVTAGKERARLNSSAESRHVGTWHNMMVVASNESIAGHAEYVSKDSEAGRVRIMEINVPKITTEQNMPQINDTVVDLKENYGVIGEEYARYLVENQADVKKKVSQMYAYFSKGRDQTSRFWVSSATALAVGALLANRMGYALVDLPEFYRWLSLVVDQQLAATRNSYAEESDRALDVVLEFIQANRTQFAVVEHLPVRGRVLGQVYYVPQIGEIVGMIAKKSATVRISHNAFINWMYKNSKGSPNMVLRMLKDDPNVTESKTSLTGGVGNTLSHARTRCLDIKCDASFFASMAADIDFDEPPPIASDDTA